MGTLKKIAATMSAVLIMLVTVPCIVALGVLSIAIRLLPVVFCVMVIVLLLLNLK